MKTKTLAVVLLSCVLALVVGLVGCGDSTAAGKAAFTGTWDLSSMEQDGEATSSEDIETLKAYGLEVYLVLGEDGKAMLMLFGEATEGSWEPKSATEASITLEDSPIAMTLADNKLTMESDTSKLVFVKGEPRTS